MKKLLLSSVAICGLALAGPAVAAEHSAHAGGVKLDLGGFYKGYAAFVDQEEASSSDVNEFDWLQNTEVYFTGETVLDNGLVVGYHAEVEADGNDSFDVQESYAYFSGAWGRVNAGAENGAAYLLQVEAPSADSNVDGLRTFINPVNYAAAPGVIGELAGAIDGGIASGTTLNDFGTPGAGGDDVITNSAIDGGAISELFVFDYDDDITGYSNKVTYLTPVFSGFQAGVSYSPETTEDSRTSPLATGVGTDNGVGDYGDSFEIGARYEGEFEGFGFALGAGYSHSELEEGGIVTYVDADDSGTFNAGDEVVASLDDRTSWNVGLDVDFGGFGLGAAYVQDDLGFDDGADRDTLVVGGDYTTGPWKVGLSYYNQDQEVEALYGEGEIETDRYTGGVVYTYGPGMTFRGSISYIDHEIDGSDDVDATSVLLGTQIKF